MSENKKNQFIYFSKNITKLFGKEVEKQQVFTR